MIIEVTQKHIDKALEYSYLKSAIGYAILDHIQRNWIATSVGYYYVNFHPAFSNLILQKIDLPKECVDFINRHLFYPYPITTPEPFTFRLSAECFML